VVCMPASLLLLCTSAAAAFAPAGLQTVAAVPACRAISPPLMEAADKRKEIAKACRAVSSQGLGGLKAQKTRKGRRTEQKAPPKGRGFGKNLGTLNFDRRPKPDATCGCGSGRAYADCCKSAHDDGRANEPEALARARYTAYAYRLPDFLIGTTDPNGDEMEADVAKWRATLLNFMDDFCYDGLEVVSTEAVGEAEAVVKFRAEVAQKETLNLKVLVERATFTKDASGAWLYTRGDVEYEAPQ